jgi:beta-galactosidase
LKHFNQPVLLTALWFLAWGPLAASAQAPVRKVIDFGPQWRFFEGDQPLARQSTFDDSAWRNVSVPHDWSIAGPISESNPSGPGGGFFPTGIGWYRKSFSLDARQAHRHVYVVFDGVMANSDAWINGFHLGHRPNGYVSFFYDLTGHLQFGASAHNVIAVRCDTSQQPASRWYEGSGIYRPVRLVLIEDVHLVPWSTAFTTPAVTSGSATVRMQGAVINHSDAPRRVVVEVSLTGPDGRPAGSFITPEQTIGEGAQREFTGSVSVPNPQLWDIDHPSLYRALAVVRIISGPKRSSISDSEQVEFGIREFRFDATTGFWLNGRNLKIKGAAIHADGGAFGIAVPGAVWERRLRALRVLGVNAIRTAHNPPSPQFLDLCDRLGFLVMDELFDCWTVGKNPYDYHLYFDEWSSIDTRDTVLRDRNHPSIILWSAGNEIHDTPHAELAHAILARLLAVFHENDPSRPVTQALFRPNQSHDYENGLADMLDVVGQNYRENEILAAHDANPSRKILGTENTLDRGPWLALRDHAAYSGQFLWSGLDYLGESGKWPLISRPFGLLDRAALPHARALERESWWADVPNVHIARRVAPAERAATDPGYEPVPAAMQETLLLNWTPRNTAPHLESVEVYTNCEEVDLVLNGQSLGRQKLHQDASPLVWAVPFRPGSLKALAYDHGVQVVEDELRTAGKATRIALTGDRATASTGDDVVTIIATAVDEKGIQVPDASDEVQFTVTGPGEIVATDNGSILDHDSFSLPRHHLYSGRAIAFVRATASSGAIRVLASAPGLAGGDLNLKAAPAAPSQFARSF